MQSLSRPGPRPVRAAFTLSPPSAGAGHSCPRQLPGRLDRRLAPSRSAAALGSRSLRAPSARFESWP
eukprot:6118375-Alexandrium_andersonii.AAC.1